MIFKATLWMASLGAAVGQLVINEIMRNPALVATERAGEWFELYNPSSAIVDINGWTIQDDGSNGHVIDNGGPLLIGPDEYLVLGNNGNTTTNGGVVLDYEYDTRRIHLNNAPDELVLLDGASNEIDRVNWDAGETFPNQDGAAMALIDPDVDNNLSYNWCNASTPYGLGDNGTPGAPNDCPLPKLVINEIMRNPDVVATEREGEWFEIFNADVTTVDINRWIIKDDGSNGHVIENGGPLLIAPGEYLVLGNNGNITTNGGVAVDYVFDATRIHLNNNGEDELVLLNFRSVEVDRVNWDSTYPNVDGAAMALLNPELDNNLSYNWCNALTVYGSGDLGTPGAANDCPLPKVVINEIMRNPANVATEREGEWFELFNPTASDIDINGWTIKDDGYNNHVIDNGGPLLIASGGYLVLGNNDNGTINGGVALDYEYMHVFLNNNDPDELVLLDVFGNEIDRVNWDGGVAYPNEDGAAMALIHPSLDNNVGGNWCNATTVYGAGDKGTPGAQNDCVSMLVINEIMRNPANVATEREGEWFELYNPTGSDIDIDGWTIVDDGSNNHVIDNGGPLVILSGGYLVLGNNADTSTNGNVNLDYEYMTIFLNNAADELVLLNADGEEIDRVNWDGGATFPNVDGESMALVSPALDNNLSSNWCGSSTVFGDGDLGTPGAENDCTGGRRLRGTNTQGGLRGFP